MRPFRLTVPTITPSQISTSFNPLPTSPPSAPRNSTSPSKMRSTWRLCGMPIRRPRRKRPPPPPPSQSVPLTLMSTSCNNGPSCLSRFAEDSSSAGLSDMDLENAVVEAVADTKSNAPRTMVMDAQSRKWTGNEQEFERFGDLVRSLGTGKGASRGGADWHPFLVGKAVTDEWEKNGKEHNQRLQAWQGAEATDIRNFANEFHQLRCNAGQQPTRNCAT